jgi:hypothetical protein
MSNFIPALLLWSPGLLLMNRDRRLPAMQRRARDATTKSHQRR